MASSRTYTLASTAWPSHIWQVPEDRMFDQLNININEAATAISEPWSSDFAFEWVWLSEGPPRRHAVRVRAFDDSWLGLLALEPLLRHFDHSRYNRKIISMLPPDFIAYLDGMGFVPSVYHGQLARRKEGGA